jgi:hypothetical protein
MIPAVFSEVLLALLSSMLIHVDCHVQILGLHIIPGVYKAADFATLTEVKTLGGAILSVSTEGDKVTFTGPDSGTSASVTQADLMSCQGVVHKIDGLLVPGSPENRVIESIMPTPAPAPVEMKPEEPETMPMPMPMPAPVEATPEEPESMPMPMPAPVEATPEEPAAVPMPMTPVVAPEEAPETLPMPEEGSAPVPGPAGAMPDDCSSILDLAVNSGDLKSLVTAIEVSIPSVVPHLIRFHWCPH